MLLLRTACTLVFIFSILAQERASATESTIAMPIITVSGNRKVDRNVIVRLSGLEGKPDMPAEEIRSRLTTTGLFSDVLVQRNKHHVWIRLREKITWFVLPFFSADAVSTTFALAFGKSAILRENMTGAAEYQFGSGDHKIAAQLRDEVVAASPVMLQSGIDFESAFWRVYRGREVVQRTRNDIQGGSFGIGYRVSPYIIPSLINYFENHQFDDEAGLRSSGFQWSTKAEIKFTNFYLDEGLADGLFISAYVEATPPLSAFRFFKTGTSAQYSVINDAPLNWVVTGRAEFSPALPRYQLFQIGGADLRGFSIQQFRDRGFLVVQNDLSLLSLNLASLRLRPFLFGDWAFINDGPHEALGAGIRFYVRTVAISAFQVYAGYGFNPNGLNISVAVGEQF